MEANITPLRPAIPPARKPDPTGTIRQRRHRAKKKAQAVTKQPAKPAPGLTKKPSETKALFTPSRAKKALHRQTAAAIVTGVVGLGLMALTLTHTARGTMLVTGAELWEAWAMAIGVDLAYVTLKITLLTASDRVRKQVGWLAEAAIVGTLAGSAAMNIAAFTAAASNPYTLAAGALMGAAIPALLYILTQVGAAAWIDCHARA